MKTNMSNEAKCLPGILSRPMPGASEVTRRLAMALGGSLLLILLFLAEIASAQVLTPTSFFVGATVCPTDLWPDGGSNWILNTSGRIDLVGSVLDGESMATTIANYGGEPGCVADTSASGMMAQATAEVYASVAVVGNPPSMFVPVVFAATGGQLDSGSAAFYMGTGYWDSTAGQPTSAMCNGEGLASCDFSFNETFLLRPGTICYFNYQAGAIASGGYPGTGSGAVQSAWVYGPQIYIAPSFLATNSNFSLEFSPGFFTMSPGIAPFPRGSTAFSPLGTNLLLNVTNCISGRTYIVLTSTNALLPLSKWTPVWTNVCSTSGNFTITATNAVNPKDRQQFYTLRME
ncbi:MAG TPA: hypothetical protein VNV43_07670 [Candidatus Acidoferrales bacterium]|nr:hypothetical protein [Candidatus Acidoferrales bacterium]